MDKTLQEKISQLQNDELKEILNEIVLLDTKVLKEKKDELINELQTLVKKYPLTSVLIAAVLGFILGRISK